MIIRRTISFAALLLLSTSLLAGTGRIVIINADPPGTGFNDPTPVAPIGGNPGTTIGEQRYNVYIRAAERWSNALDTVVDIRVRGSFAPLACNDDGLVLGQSYVLGWHANFTNAPRTEIWYPAALANKFAGRDLSGDPSPDGTPTTPQDDMFIQFSSALDDPTCSKSSWYYGYDGDEGDNQSLYHVVLHEIGHGLGISSPASTEFFLNRPSVFDLNTFDLSAGQRWDQMTTPQRELSMTNTANLVWSGEHVTRMAPGYLDPATIFTVTQPAAAARSYDIGIATFGPPAQTAAMSGRVVPAADAANGEGLSATDGCTAFSNTESIDGNIALIDRGSCSFVQKALNAQSAGAVGVIIADNVRTTCLPPVMGRPAGDSTSITIPVISVTQNDGAAIRTHLGQNAEVRGMLRVDPSRLAGASDSGYVRLYAPCSFKPGSSKHHFDVVASPNLLMEPEINPDLPDGLDLSIYQLRDMGWTTRPRTVVRIRVPQ